ncbi:hypothetical protein EV360DRAFT_88706 [Lentinula raphanica]|nr:hypothetical protein EV360DRAFT_88706 [Lentinula raphanica]
MFYAHVNVNANAIAHANTAAAAAAAAAPAHAHSHTPTPAPAPAPANAPADANAKAPAKVKAPANANKEFATAFAQFTSLKQLSICGLYGRLNFGSPKIQPPIRRLIGNSTTMFDEELRVLWYVAWVAKEIRHLDAIYIVDTERHINTYWCLEGWLLVVNDNREIGGTLEQIEGGVRYNHFEVLLEPSMLST